MKLTYEQICAISQGAVRCAEVEGAVCLYRFTEELPTAEEPAKIMDTIGISRSLDTISVDAECAKLTFKATKDIRDKYVLSRLAWDLGILDELAEKVI